MTTSIERQIKIEREAHQKKDVDKEIGAENITESLVKQIERRIEVIVIGRKIEICVPKKKMVKLAQPDLTISTINEVI